MHEYSLAHGLLEGLLGHLRENPVDGTVRAVQVRKGELVILSEEALGEAWRILSEGTALAGSRLELETVPTKVRCSSCGFEGRPGHLSPDEEWHFKIPLLSCPRCGGRVEVVEGKELAAVSLSVEEPQGARPGPPTAGGRREAQGSEGDRPEDLPH